MRRGRKSGRGAGPRPAGGSGFEAGRAPWQRACCVGRGEKGLGRRQQPCTWYRDRGLCVLGGWRCPAALDDGADLAVLVRRMHVERVVELPGREAQHHDQRQHPGEALEAVAGYGRHGQSGIHRATTITRRPGGSKTR